MLVVLVASVELDGDRVVHREKRQELVDGLRSPQSQKAGHVACVAQTYVSVVGAVDEIAQQPVVVECFLVECLVMRLGFGFVQDGLVMRN